MDYTELRAAVAANIEAQTIAQRYYEKAQAEAEEWESKHQLALKQGCEESIRETEFRKHVSATKARNLKAVLDEQTYTLAILKHKLSVAQRNFTDFPTTQIQPYCQSAGRLPAIDLQTKLRELERTLEATKVQLLQQQATISKLLKENSAALEQLRTFLVEDSYHSTDMVGNTAIEALISYLEADNNLSNEFSPRKNPIFSTSTNSQAKVISLCVNPEFAELKNKLNHC